MSGFVNINPTSTTPEPLLGIKDEPKAQLSDHLMQLPGGQWALWRCVGLRGAGFPASTALKLASPGCAAAADELLQVEDEVRRSQEEAVDVVNKALDELRLNSGWEDKSERNRLLNVLRLLKQGKLPGPSSIQAPYDAAIEAFQAAREIEDSLRVTFHERFKAVVSNISYSIRDVAQTDRFREAIIWQNRQALHTAVGPLLRKPPHAATRGSKQRQYEELIANYLQRYCLKNDTIGFFGPVGWAKLVSEGEAMIAMPGHSLLAKREVYFEPWCIDVLASKLAESKAIRLWAAPRRMPFIRVEGAMLYLGSSQASELSPKHAALLKACNGDCTASEIAEQMVSDLSGNFRRVVDVYRALWELNDLALISWALDVHIDAHPERALRRLLDRVEQESLRSKALQALSELEQGREMVASAAGDAEKLDKALGDLGDTFTRLTGAASTRGAGKTYAGRTLVFEDCRRDIEVNIGPEVLNELGPPLSLLLTSARWTTYKMAQIYRKAFTQIYVDIARKTGSRIVDGVAFWLAAQPLLDTEVGSPADTIGSMLRERWFNVLSMPPGESRVEYKTEDLRPRVLAAFNAPNSGWQFARYHSPDVMIAAPSVEAIRQGNYQLVMGELHCAINTLGSSLFLEQHPCQEELLRAVDIDLSQPRLVAVMPKSMPNANLRTRHELQSPKDLRVILAHDSIPDPGIQGVPISDIIVEYRGGELIARTRDGRFSFEIIEALGDILSTYVVDCLKLTLPDNHTPRVSIDRLVVWRESWRFYASEAEFACEKEETQRFLAARRWANQRGIPRFAFVKVPVETKPFYVDFDSPIYVEIFTKMIRRTTENGGAQKLVTLSEMLPAADQTWLPDAEGQKYTSELRIVALDMEAKSEGERIKQG